jgi:hypothetical protein
MTKTDLKPYASLSIVTINGFDSSEENDIADPPGSANWLCWNYEYSPDSCEGFNPEENGIIWTDYDTTPDRPWLFTVLIDSEEVDDLVKTINDNGYSFSGVKEVTEPMNYGDGSGTVVILKHPDGWVVFG